MTIAPPFSNAAAQVKISFRAGRSPDSWRRSLSDQVQPLASLRRACKWVTEQAQSVPRLQPQPLLGNCLSDVLNGWEAERSPVPIRSPKPQIHHPEAATAAPKPSSSPRFPSQTKPRKDRDDTGSSSSSQPSPLSHNLPAKASSMLLNTCIQSSTGSSSSPSPTAPHPHAHVRQSDFQKAPLKPRPAAAPNVQPSSTQKRLPFPPCSDAATQQWLDDVEQRSQTSLYSTPATALPSSTSPEKNPYEGTSWPTRPVHNQPNDPISPTSATEPARSQTPTAGPQASLDYLAYLVDAKAASTPNAAPTPSRADCLDTSARDTASDRQQQASGSSMIDLLRAEARQSLDSSTSLAASPHLPLVDNTQQGTTHQPAPTQPAFNPQAIALSQPPPSITNGSSTSPQPSPIHPFLEPMAASLPTNPLPNLLSRSQPDTSPPAVSDLRPPDQKNPPDPEDLGHLADKIQQILNAEARRHGISF